jgi:aryl-alcohol dehydrogenase-like predicted oxidoreductase
MERSAFETELLPVVEKYQTGAIPYYLLAGGCLTGKYRSQKDAEKVARGATVEKYLNERGFGVVAALDEVAYARGSTLLSVCRNKALRSLTRCAQATQT